jgi:hypothetical protein
MRRGQAALEYLLTYGWGFLVILVTIGALAYFGILNPGKFVPEKCEFGTQLECADWQLKRIAVDDQVVSLLLRNSFGEDIEMRNVWVVTDEGRIAATDIDEAGGSLVIAAGDTGDFTITFETGLDLQAGEQQRVIMEIDFRRFNPTGSQHTLRGSVYAEVVE